MAACAASDETRTMLVPLAMIGSSRCARKNGASPRVPETLA
jgi:hypothetical protein